jgi:hypothetical protein
LGHEGDYRRSGEQLAFDYAGAAGDTHLLGRGRTKSVHAEESEDSLADNICQQNAKGHRSKNRAHQRYRIAHRNIPLFSFATRIRCGARSDTTDLRLLLQKLKQLQCSYYELVNALWGTFRQSGLAARSRLQPVLAQFQESAFLRETPLPIYMDATGG